MVTRVDTYMHHACLWGIGHHRSCATHEQARTTAASQNAPEPTAPSKTTLNTRPLAVSTAGMKKPWVVEWAEVDHATLPVSPSTASSVLDRPWLGFHVPFPLHARSRRCTRRHASTQARKHANTHEGASAAGGQRSAGKPTATNAHAARTWEGDTKQPATRGRQASLEMSGAVLACFPSFAATVAG